jgi:Domain of unknown function DUF1829/Domain of unknown function DUF1828
MSEIDLLIEGYWRWLRERSSIKQIDDWTEITTPYLDRHNDYLQIYARKEGKNYVITDGGDTLSDLEQSGCVITTTNGQAILRSILNGFGVEHHNGELQVHASPDNFAIRKHNLIQAILSVHDMFFLASPTIEALFFEDVAAWLEASEIRFTSRVKLAGKTGFDHMFDFVIPKSRSASERILKAINNPNKTTTMALIAAWLDTRASRPEDSQPYAILNDTERPVGGSVTDALTNYGITPVEWSIREQFHDKLAA